MFGLLAAGLFVVAMVVLYFALRRREREGHWDKEGFGPPEHPDPGPKYRPLEVPPSKPFD